MKKIRPDQEKVSEILKKAKVNLSSKTLGESIIANKCSTCSAELKALEQVVFFDKCYSCAKANVENYRESFFKRYLLQFLLVGLMIIINGYINNFTEKSIFMLILQSFTIAFTLLYISFNYIKKAINHLKMQYKALVIMVLSLAVISLTIGIIKVGSVVITLYFLTVLGLLVYNVYKDYAVLKEKYNLVNIYERKSNDTEYVNSVKQAIKNKGTDIANTDTLQSQTLKNEANIIKNLENNKETLEKNENSDNGGGNWII